MKKLTILFVCMLLICTQVCALADVSKADIFPLAEPVTYTVVMQQQGGSGSTESDVINSFDIMKMYAADTNVHFDITCISKDAMPERLTLMMAGDSYPDCFFRNTIGTADILKYAADGVFIRLNDYINEEYMPNYMKAMRENDPSLKAMMSDENGDIFYILGGTPSYLIHSQWAINKTWLENLNLEIPTSIDEYINVLRAFRDQDANGDGDPKNEIPFSFTLDGGYETPLYYTFGAYAGIYESNDGKVAYGPIEENFKEMIKFLKTLYDEKLLDQETFTQDRNTFLAKGKLEPSLYGSFLNWRAGEVVGDEIAANDYASMILSVDGKINQWTPDNSFTSFMCLAVTDKCQDVETLIRFVDYTFDPMISELSRRGGSPTFTVINEDGTLTPNPIPAEIGTLGNWFVAAGHTQQVPMFSVNEYAKMFANTVSASEKYAIDDFYTPYLGEPQPTIGRFLTSEQTEEVNDLRTDISKYVSEKFATWVTGEADIDSEWDAYIAQLYNMDLERFIEIYQAAYDRMLTLI